MLASSSFFIKKNKISLISTRKFRKSSQKNICRSELYFPWEWYVEWEGVDYLWWCRHLQTW